MAWRAAAAAQLLLGQLSFVSLRLSGVGAQTNPAFQLWQPQDKVSVVVGGTLTLTCTTSGAGPAGPTKWLKGLGSENETIYDQNSPPPPRVTRIEPWSNTDFSIHIGNVHPEDAGTYYCIKFRKVLGRGDEVFQQGKGTEVSLHDVALVPSTVAVIVVLCLLLLLSLFIAFYMYRRKHQGQAENQSLDGKVLDAETSQLPSQQQSSKEPQEIHYAELQPLPKAPRRSKRPVRASPEYASVRVAAK
ncbi:PREDICTED: tyrosine-protein phosphatase non-receptor type substrate 1-like [Chaetura pelagica]|uniref:tyrosine-protein phosphatase non-receptor type substrate 1-like n=1 Tax=Chaetura pelagica TaxID=8897 RepID=UPI000523195E|nr:PREDICTED: tyrosine-protein phosphatase non-receptor type substrate 1-like [Chaetura pelagica]